jgi:hypothetical protein
MSLVSVFTAPPFGHPSTGGEFAGLSFWRSKDNNVGTRFSEIEEKTTRGWLVFRRLRRKQLWDGSFFGNRGENNSGMARFSEIEEKTTLGWLVFRKSRRKQLWEMLDLQKT